MASTDPAAQSVKRGRSTRKKRVSLFGQHSGETGKLEEFEEDKNRPTRWSMGVLNDPLTHEVPGICPILTFWPCRTPQLITQKAPLYFYREVIEMNHLDCGTSKQLPRTPLYQLNLLQHHQVDQYQPGVTQKDRRRQRTEESFSYHNPTSQ